MKRLLVILRKPLVLGVVMAGVTATLVSASAAQRGTDAHTERWISERAEIVRGEVESTVNGLADGLEAVGAFMEVSSEVDQVAFSEFVGRLDESLSLIGVAYMGIVPADDLSAYEAAAAVDNPDFVVREVTDLGEEMDRLGQREVYYPVELFEPGSLLIPALQADENPLALGVGVDGGSVAEWRVGLAQALETDQALVSGFITLGTVDTEIGQAFVIAVPVRGDGPESAPTGLLAAPMIDRLLPTELDVSITDDVTWEIAGADDELTGETTDTAWEGDLVVSGSTWQLRVQPTAEGLAGLGGLSGWVVIAIGLALTVVLATLAELMLQRTRSKARVMELQRVSDDKDRFLAAVSHEIRTPLTAVSGLTVELRDRPLDFEPSELQQLLETIAEQADEVSAIVEDLLVAARSDIGKVSVSHSAVDLSEQVRAALDGSGPSADIVGRPTALAYADPQRVRQILRNLLTNAARYGGEKIQVRFDSTELAVTVEVADSGSPIAADHVETIFDAYTSTENTVVGSIGLGLFVSRILAELMGGSLSYRHDGEWGVFSLSLPSVAVAHRVAETQL